jgi:hypothetical protein
LFKWILGVGGYILTRNFLGAILGFSIGTFIDNYRTMLKMAERREELLTVQTIFLVFINNVRRRMIFLRC